MQVPGQFFDMVVQRRFVMFVMFVNMPMVVVMFMMFVYMAFVRMSREGMGKEVEKYVTKKSTHSKSQQNIQ